MFYKNWPHWLKGGIVGFIALFLMAFVFQIFWLSTGLNQGALDPELNSRLQGAYFISGIYVSIFLGVIGFVLGVVIGLIFGGIKKFLKK